MQLNLKTILIICFVIALIGGGGFYDLETDGQPGDDQRQETCHRKQGQIDLGMVGKRLKPPVHETERYRPGD